MKEDEKIIHVSLRDNPDITVEEVYNIMMDLQKKYPDREIFYDGDAQAICSRPKKMDPKK